MSHPAQCSVCDTALNPYGQDTRCARCNEDCPVCGKDVSLCHHKLADSIDERLTEVVHGDPFLRRVAGDAVPARAASLRPQPASRFSQSGIAIARKSA